MSRKNLLSLHEAIVIGLVSHPNKSATFAQKAEFLDERQLNPFREGNIPLSTQVILRSTKSKGAYAYLFKQLDVNSIQLRMSGENG